MADTVSFCVVPSILVYSLYVEGLPPLLGGVISFIPLMFGTIRLAKFNIEQEPEKPKSYTIGLTTTIATITLFSYLFFNHQIDGDYGDPRTALMLVAALGILNKLLGVVFGALKIGLVLSVVFIFFGKINSTIPFVDKEKLEESVLYAPVKQIAPTIFPSIIKDESEDNTKKEEVG